jgi:hypothetical protein
MPAEPVVAALDVLEFLGLVSHFRVSQVVRLYQSTLPSDPQRRDAWARLLALASRRAGRVRLAKHLRGGDQTAQAQWHETQHVLAEARQSVQASQRLVHPHTRGEDSWQKAI